MTREDLLPCAPPRPRSALKIAVAAFPVPSAVSPTPAPSSAAIDRQADRALDALYTSSDNAQALANSAHAVLVFAHVNAGPCMQGPEGEGVMRIGGASTAYYRIVGAPAGTNTASPFSLAFFFVAPWALARLNAASCEMNRGGSSGAGGILSTTTLTEEVYDVRACRRGMIAGLGLHGSRIFRIRPA